MKIFRNTISAFLLCVLLAPLASAASTSRQIMQVYTDQQAVQSAESDMLPSAPTQFRNVDYRYRILRNSDPSSMRKGEVVMVSRRRAQQVYAENKVAKQALADTQTDMLTSNVDNAPYTVERPALSPWYSLNWKNRLRAAFKKSDAQEMTYKKPEIEAKRYVTPFNIYGRSSTYNAQEGSMEGKRKLIRTLKTRSPFDAANGTR